MGWEQFFKRLPKKSDGQRMKTEIEKRGKNWGGLDVQTDNGMCVEGTASLNRSVDYTHIYIQSVHILHLTTLTGCFC